MLGPVGIPSRELTTRPSRSFSVSDNPEANSVTTPSPALSVFPPPNSRNEGIIPISFGSDDKSRPNPLVPPSDHTFGISGSRTPTDTSPITPNNTVLSLTDTRPALGLDSAVGPPDGREDFLELTAFSTPRAFLARPNFSRFSAITIDQLSGAAVPDSEERLRSPYDTRSQPPAIGDTTSPHAFQSSGLPPSPSENTPNHCTPFSAGPSSGNGIVIPAGRSMFTLSACCSDDAPSVDDRSEIRSSFASDGVPLLRQPKDDVRGHPSSQSPIHEGSLVALEGSGSPISPHVLVGNAGNNLPSAFYGSSLNPIGSSPVAGLPRLSHVHDPEIAAALAKRTSSHPGTSYQEQLVPKHARANYRRLGSSSSRNQENMVNPTSTARESNTTPSGPVFGPAKESSSSTDARASDASDLEPSLRHLKDLVVGLYIDQERFREINPQFVFNHYRREDQLSETTSESSVSDGSEVSPHVSPSFMPSVMFPGGIAEYRLIETQSWCFHYSAFDSAPTLRRMSLNGDTTHDYMSRESSLTVKSNGTYSVRGSEGKGQAPWEFRYSTEDRLTSNGEKMNGEKMFTPLCFMCSPKLLNPECGKKIGLLQVVKKSVSPKISASKVDKLSYTSLPIPVVPKISNSKPPNPSTLDRTILPLVVKTTVVTSSAPTSGAIASTTMWETKAGSPAFNVDLAPTDSVGPPHPREINVSESFRKGFPLFGKRHTSSILGQARNSKLPRRPETSADQTQTQTSGPSLRSPSNTEHLRPATAGPRTAPYLPRSTIERPGRQEQKSSTLNPDPQPIKNAVSLVNPHPSPVRTSSPTASPEQIKKSISETSSRKFPSSRAPVVSPLSIPSRSPINSSVSSHPVSPSAYRGTVSPPLTPIVDAAGRPSLPSSPRPRLHAINGPKRPSTANGKRRVPDLWPSSSVPSP